MGFTLPQTYRYVILPMAFRLVVPPPPQSLIFSKLGCVFDDWLVRTRSARRQLVDRLHRTAIQSIHRSYDCLFAD